MAQGRVVHQAALEPDHLGHPEVVGEHLGQVLAAEPRVALRVEHGSGADQAGPLAIDVERAALQRHGGREARHLQALADRFGEARVRGGARRPLPMAVQAPVDAGEPAILAADEGRGGVAGPGVVVLERQDRDPLAALQRGLGGQIGPRDHGHRLEQRDRLRELGDRLARRIHALAPELRPAGPGHPAAVVPRPFGRHRKALLARRGHARPPSRSPRHSTGARPACATSPHGPAPHDRGPAAVENSASVPLRLWSIRAAPAIVGPGSAGEEGAR